MAKLACPECGCERNRIAGGQPRKAERSKIAVATAYHRRRKCTDCATVFRTVEVTAAYLETLERMRVDGTLGELLRARSGLDVTINELTKVSRRGELL